MKSENKKMFKVTWEHWYLIDFLTVCHFYFLVACDWLQA